MNKRFEGYYEKADLPIKKGDRVTIPKGTSIRTTMPQEKDKLKVAGRTYKVTVHHILSGMSSTKTEWDETTQKYIQVQTPMKGPLGNPLICWVGEGGYWHEAEINDIPEAQIQGEPK